MICLPRDRTNVTKQLRQKTAATVTKMFGLGLTMELSTVEPLFNKVRDLTNNIL